MVRAGELNALALPIDGWVVVVQPRHAQDDVVSRQGQRDEVETVGVRADDERRGWNEGSSGLLAPICEGDDVLRRQGHGRYVMLGDKSIVDEVAGGAAVEEEHSGAAGKGAAQLEQRAGRRGDLVDLREERLYEDGRRSLRDLQRWCVLRAGIVVGIEGRAIMPLVEPVEH